MNVRVARNGIEFARGLSRNRFRSTRSAAVHSIPCTDRVRSGKPRVRAHLVRSTAPGWRASAETAPVAPSAQTTAAAAAAERRRVLGLATGRATAGTLARGLTAEGSLKLAGPGDGRRRLIAACRAHRSRRADG